MINELWNGVHTETLDDLLNQNEDINDPAEHFADDNEQDQGHDFDEYFEDKEESDHLCTNIESQPLFEGARITLAVSMLLIIKYSVRHSITGVALADLLLLIEVHILSPNILGKSMATLRNFFKQLKSPIEYHYFCSFCYEYIGKSKEHSHCPNRHCQKDLSIKLGSLGYFIVIPLINQLQALLASKYIYSPGVSNR